MYCCLWDWIQCLVHYFESLILTLNPCDYTEQSVLIISGLCIVSVSWSKNTEKSLHPVHSCFIKLLYLLSYIFCDKARQSIFLGYYKIALRKLIECLTTNNEQIVVFIFPVRPHRHTLLMQPTGNQDIAPIVLNCTNLTINGILATVYINSGRSTGVRQLCL